jgi:hypothetical protein
MAFVTQDPTAPKSDANGYIDVVEFKAYHDDRGNVHTASDTDIEKAIVRATDYIDSRWTFAGNRQDEDQSTECPRSGVFDPMSRYAIDGYPEELKQATAEYALAALAGTLYAASNVDQTGRSVKTTRKKADVLEKETEYFGPTGSNKQLWVAFPVADGKMKRTRLLAPTRRTLGRA